MCAQSQLSDFDRSLTSRHEAPHRQATDKEREMKRLTHRSLRVLLVATAAFLAAGGIAFATIPSGSGVISACYVTRTWMHS